MFVFPLGLQAKTRDFPWMTLTILVATSVYSILTFDVTQTFFHSVGDAQVKPRFQKQKALVAATCPAETKLVPADCDVLRRTLKIDLEETPEAFLKRFADDHDVQALERSRIREMAKFAVDSEIWRKPSETVRAMPEYALFEAARSQEEQARGAQARENDLLSRSSFSLKSLLRSLFLHAGWDHLIGNMVFFLMFAIPLEQRIGPIALAFIYFVGGATGMTVELMMSADPSRLLIGASASVTAIAAAFMLSFWNQSIRLWVSMFFMFNSVVLVPTWMFFALFVVVQDLSGAMNVHADGVAHVAHLGGFGIGCLLGAIASQLRFVPAPFTFPFELDLLVQAREPGDADRRLGGLREILFHNPLNTVALMDGWILLREIAAGKSWADLPKGAKVFLSENTRTLLIHLQASERGQAAEFLAMIDASDWPLETLLKPADVAGLLAQVRKLEGETRFEEALALTKLLLKSAPKNAVHGRILKAAEERLTLRFNMGAYERAGS